MSTNLSALAKYAGILIVTVIALNIALSITAGLCADLGYITLAHSILAIIIW